MIHKNLVEIKFWTENFESIAPEIDESIFSDENTKNWVIEIF